MTRPVSPAIERLEPRRLLDATLDGNTLAVLGTAGSEKIIVLRVPGPTDGQVYEVSIGPRDGKAPTRVWTFPVDKVASVLVRAGAGDDVVDLHIATYFVPHVVGYNVVGVPARIDGGLGDDEIYGGARRDLILGSFGKDRIRGFGGDDWIDGGWGDDHVRGDTGNDLVFGSWGNDNLGGDAGNDRLYGGPGDDFLGSVRGGPLPIEPGDDLLVGGSGNDSLVGGEGKDQLFGGPGRDRFSLADDESEMLDRTPDEPVDIPLPQ